jgi:hypothetical protein
MKELGQIETVEDLQSMSFFRSILSVLLGLLLVSVISCSADSNNSGQNSTTTAETSAGNPELTTVEVPVGTPAPTIEPVGKQEISVTNEPSSDNPEAEKNPEPAPTSSAAASGLPQSLSDLSLLEDPAFQRRAKLGHLVAKRRCILCHKVDGRGGILQPPLVQVAVRRLGRMELFPAHLETLRQEDPHRYESKKDLFDAIEDESDLLRKMSRWLHGYLKQPTFDNAQAKMPLQVLKPEEIDQLVSYVIQLAIDGVKEGVKPPE